MDWWQWLNFFLQIVCSSSCERGRSSSHSSMSTTTPPCESASWYLYSTHLNLSEPIWTHLNPSEPIFPLRFPLWWIGAKYVAGGSSFLVTRHYDHWSATNHLDWSGRLLQLLCPCDHVLLLCPFHSGGQRQVVFMAIMNWIAMLRKSRMVACMISMAGKIVLTKNLIQAVPVVEEVSDSITGASTLPWLSQNQ